MSIAAISSSFVSTAGAAAVAAPVDTVSSNPASQGSDAAGGRRHELVNAMNQVLGITAAHGAEEPQAVLRFAHALMQDLRTANGGDTPGAVSGQAWSRRDWSDLAQRIGAVASAAGAPAAALPDAASASGTASLAGAPASAAAAATAAAASTAEALAQAALPQPSKPVTSISTGIALMRVPSSRLIEAYASLRKALGDQPSADTTESTRSELAGFLGQLSSQLAPGASATLPAGSVLNVSV